MNCVYYSDKKPNGFIEEFVFSKEIPYTIHIRNYPLEDIVPLHYAKTIEILLCDHLDGQMVIDSNQYELHGRQLFIIPPYTVHSTSINICAGTLYVLKISLPEMEHYIHIPHLLEARGCQLDQLTYLCPAYEKAKELIDGCILHDGDLPMCMSLLLQLFCLLSQYVDTDRTDIGMHSRRPTSSLQELILWTQENFSKKITIDEAAKRTGYSKYYFCSRFKELTGITYLNYVNSVRISHACLLLRNGQSVQEISSACGFDNVSYFIQVFKRIQHSTPKQYAARCQVVLEGAD